MNSRDRVITALNHQEPDRVPIDFGSLHTSIHRDGHKKLLEYLGMEIYDAPIIDMFQQIVNADPALREKFHDDVTCFFANPGIVWKLEIDPETDSWADEWGVSYHQPPSGFWYDFKDHPLKEGTSEELKRYKMPDPRDPNRIKGLAEKAKIYFHSCGSIYWALPDTIEAGLETINPFQLSAKDMDPAKIKKEFGKDLSFWGGGADARGVMSSGTPLQVKEQVKQRFHDLAPGGGFVFGSVHNIQANVPPENVIAFFEAAYEYGEYPISV